MDSLRLLAPGLLVAATGVGAGDLITASLAGAETGLVLLWAVALGALAKLLLNEGLARWQMATGTTLLEGWVRHLGGWIRWVFLAYLLLWTYCVAGALMSACGVAGDALLPLSSDPVRSRVLWGGLHSLGGVALVLAGGFRLFETVMGWSVGLMFCTVLVTAIGLGAEPAAVARGLVVPQVPPGGLKWVLGLLGGVGGSLTLLSYGYWIREEGRQGAGGLAACRRDLAVAYALTGVFSCCMVVIGSRLPAIAGPQGVQLAARLGEALVPVLGQPGRLVFLVGFWAAVFSSLLGVWQGVPYLFADFLRLHQGRELTPGEDLTQGRAYRGYLLAMAVVPALNLWRTLRTVQLAYAVLGALFMPLLAATLLRLNSREDLTGEMRSGPATQLGLAAVLAFFAWAAWRKWAG